MFNKENCYFVSNYTADTYASVMLSALFTGTVFRTIPSEFRKTDFGVVLSDKRDFEKFWDMHDAIKKYQKKVLCNQFGITQKDIIDCTRAYKLELGNENVIYPEYKLPNILPLDLVAIADHADALEQGKTFKYNIIEGTKTIPYEDPGNKEAYVVLFDSKPQSYVDLWTIAAYLSGYDTQLYSCDKVDGEHRFGIKGSSTQTFQKESFFYVIDEVEKQCKNIFVESGYKTEDFSLRLFSEMVYKGDIEEPVKIDWKSIAKKSQEIVLSYYKGTDLQKDDSEKER